MRASSLRLTAPLLPISVAVKSSTTKVNSVTNPNLMVVVAGTKDRLSPVTTKVADISRLQDIWVINMVEVE